MNGQDFRDQEPVWVKYLTYVGGNSNKFYECRVDMGDDGLFYVTKRWGRRPDDGGGQTKVESSTSMSYAMGVADGMVAEKVRKGYLFAERPARADSRVQRIRTFGDNDDE